MTKHVATGKVSAMRLMKDGKRVLYRHEKKKRRILREDGRYL